MSEGEVIVTLKFKLEDYLKLVELSSKKGKRFENLIVEMMKETRAEQ